ncbi:MAG: hypothetical protein ACRDF4_06305, partial [Rhabdochlamydiaceae bacterium]
MHIANTDLEFELGRSSQLPLEKALRRNLIVHQLQFLPLLYMEKGDGVCVTDAPMEYGAGLGSESFCGRWHLLSDRHFPYDQVESWGASKCVAEWAKSRQLIYPMPPWEVVREVNSKAFSFQQIDPLPQAELIGSWNELEKWMKRVDGPKVLKSCFGLSGQGHLLLPAPVETIKSFAEREFNASRPLIAEPWVARKLDFSTQWVIKSNQSISYVGSTILLNDIKGQYAGTYVGDEEKIFGIYFSKLQAHKEIAVSTLKKMAALGFFGHVGIDAMIWGADILHPIVEINARKTMGWIALQIAKYLFPNQTIKVSYEATRHSTPLLPQGIIKPTGE